MCSFITKHNGPDVAAAPFQNLHIQHLHLRDGLRAAAWTAAATSGCGWRGRWWRCGYKMGRQMLWTLRARFIDGILNKQRQGPKAHFRAVHPGIMLQCCCCTLSCLICKTSATNFWVTMEEKPRHHRSIF